MLIGINWTGASNVERVEQLTRSGKIDFVEVMIDNFLHCNPDSIKRILNGLPCAFHIMSSRFLTADPVSLRWCAARIKKLSLSLSPLYTSDHIGLFNDSSGRSFPAMMELDYNAEAIEIVGKKIEIWSSLLDSPLHLENYASTLRSTIPQAEFFRSFLRRCNSNLLLDVSNILVASKNVGEPPEHWFPMLERAQHLHVGGYKETTLTPPFTVDDHATALSDASLETLRACISLGNIRTVCLEHDGDHSVQILLSEIRAIRDACRKH